MMSVGKLLCWFVPLAVFFKFLAHTVAGCLSSADGALMHVLLQFPSNRKVNN